MKKHFLIYLMIVIFMGNQVHAAMVYWTAKGEIKPLPCDSLLLTVPHDAAAVVLQGIHETQAQYVLNTDSASANCLYFVDEEDEVEGLPSVNVVRNGVAEELFIHDDGDFFTPVSFMAEFALLRITPRRDIEDSPTLSFPYFDTLLLPFDIDGAMPDNVNGIMPDIWMQAWGYVGDVDNTLYFEETDPEKLKANTPYIVSYQYGAYGSHVHFYGENKRVEATRLVEKMGNEYSLYGSTVSWDASDTSYQYERSLHPCFTLVSSGTWHEPFRCFVKKASFATGGEEPQDPSGEETSLNDGLEVLECCLYASVTGIPKPSQKVESPSPTIYSLSGQPLRQPQRGVNIIKGKKIYVR